MPLTHTLCSYSLIQLGLVAVAVFLGSFPIFVR